jgi:hypothetical protein
MKFSLTLILFSLVLFIASCSTTSSKNTRQLELDLILQTSNKNKEIIIESLLKEDIRFSVNFENKDSYILKDDVLNSNLKFFCKSFIQEQRDMLESSIFQNRKNDNKKVLIVYSNDFKEIVDDLNKRYPEEIYFLLQPEGYESEIKKILNIDTSTKKHLKISDLDKSIEIKHSPRIRNDISKIYFLSNYELGKTIVPIFRSYAFEVDFYATTEIFFEANDIRKLVDFENTFIPVYEPLIKEIAIKDNILSIKKELELALINDFLTIEKTHQNNLFRQDIGIDSGKSRIKRNGCIERDLSFWEITTTNLINQS